MPTRATVFRRAGLVALVALALRVPVAAGVIYVDHKAAGAANGSSWSNAFVDLQQAFAVAHAGDQIWAAAGTYKPDGGTLDPKKRFDLPSGVAVYGGFAGGETSISQRDIAANETVLTGDLLGNDGPNQLNYADNSYQLVQAVNVSAGTRLDGLTLADANGANPSVGSQAGGLYVVGGSIAVASCTFRGNYQVFGSAGMAVESGGVATVTDCTFLANNTSVASAGGAMHFLTGSNVRVTRSRFLGNTASSGGAISGGSATLILDSCLFCGNKVKGWGGALGIDNASASIANCTFVGNSAVGGGGAIDLGTGSMSVTNCILWGNTAPQAVPGEVEISSEGATVLLNNSTLEAPMLQFGGVGNSAANPLLVDPDGPDNIFGTLDDDGRLQPGSPCIDSGSNAAVPADAFDDDADGSIIEHDPLDLRRVGRFEDDPDTADVSGQSAPVVDRGCCEFSRWSNLGHALGGAKVPVLIGTGSWKPGQPLGIILTGAQPSHFGVLFVGAFAINAPFKGGVVVPFPQFANPIVTDATGGLVATGTLPADAPSNFEVDLQAWFADLAGPKGYAATNAIGGTVK
jgi:predicted outer membrane repeat protein